MKRSVFERRNAREGFLLTLPLLLGCAVFYALPFLMVLRNSLYHGIAHTERFVGLRNYSEMLRNPAFSLAFGNTVRFLVIALPVILILSFAISLMLKNQAEKHKTLKSVLLLPYIMPVVGTVLLIELLFADHGLLDQFLALLGIRSSDWLHSGWAFPIVLLLYLWKNTGYSVILLLSGLITIPHDHYEAAAIDGANRFQQLCSITLPQMWYSIFFTTVFSLINAFKCFREIFLIGGTHPDTSIYMMQHFVNNAFDRLNYPKLASASVLLLVLLLVLFSFSYSFVMKKEAYKG